jgi:hypothetical protein
MNSDIILNFQRPGNIGRMEFHTTGLTGLIPFAMDKVVSKERELS